MSGGTLVIAAVVWLALVLAVSTARFVARNWLAVLLFPIVLIVVLVTVVVAWAYVYYGIGAPPS